MDARAFVSVETAITRRLVSAWRPLAAGYYADVTDRLDDNDFAGAYDAAKAVAVDDVIERNREWIKYHLLNAAIFGARQAHPKGALFLSAGVYETTLNSVVDLFADSVRYRTNLQLMNDLTDLVVDAEDKYHSAKVEKRRYLKPLQSFKENGDYSLQMQSALHSSRLAVWGFTAEAQAVGVTRYRINGVLDGRICPYCRLVNGREFDVADARQRIVAALSATDPMALVELHPWPDQSKASIKELAQLSNEELAARGYSVPPFHPWCRCFLILVENARTPTLPIGTQVPAPTPGQQSTVDTFAELGAVFSQPEVDYWNANIGVSPVQVVSQLAGQQPDASLSGSDVPQIRVNDDGTVDFVQTGALMGPGSEVELIHSIDPVTGVMEVEALDIVAEASADAHSVADFIKNLLGNSATATTALGLAALVFYVSGGDSLYATAVNGYTPETPDWIDVSLDMYNDIAEGGPYESYFKELEPYQQQLVLDILTSPDPSAILMLVSLPYVTSTGVLFSQILLYDRGAHMLLNESDEAQLEYIGV